MGNDAIRALVHRIGVTPSSIDTFGINTLVVTGTLPTFHSDVSFCSIRSPLACLGLVIEGTDTVLQVAPLVLTASEKDTGTCCSNSMALETFKADLRTLEEVLPNTLEVDLVVLAPNMLGTFLIAARTHLVCHVRQIVREGLSILAVATTR